MTATFCLLSLPFSARADFIPVLPGPIDRVVAAGEHIAVIRKGTVFILREDGSLIGRMAGAEPNAHRGLAGSRSAKEEAEHMLDLLDVAEIDRDTDFADELLYDEQRLSQRRPSGLAARSPELPVSPPALAASASKIWMAGAFGLFQVGADGRSVRESGHEGWGAPWAAAGESLLASRGSNLALLATPASPSRFIELPSPVSKVALSKDGRRLAWVTSSGIWGAIDSDSPRNLAPANAVADLSFCGEDLVALLADSVLVFSSDGRAETRAHGIPAQRLYCPEGRAMPWLALGPKLLASTDQGRHWEAIAVPADMAPTDVAASAHHLWLATPDGLYASADGVAPLPTKRPGDRRARMGRESGSRPSSWLTWMPMPKVSVRTAATFAPGGRQLEALASAAFPLGGRSVPILSAALPEVAESEPEEPPARPRRAERVVDLRDPDESCLTLARRKAVELVMSEPERARSYVTRAGHAAWLPELRVLVSRRYGRSESIDVNSSSTALTSPLGIDTVNDIRYEARATWDLGRLVFSPEELAAQNQAIHMADLRRDIETTMNRLYFERRGLVLDMSDGRGDNVRHHLRATEIEAELNAMSGGAFASCVSGK